MNRHLTLAERVTMARMAARLSKSQLARAIKRGPSAVNHLESGRSKSLKGETLVLLAQATGCSPYWLESGLGNMHANPHLSSQEFELVELFRQMKPEVQVQWLAIGYTLRGPQASPADNIRLLPKRK